MERGFLVEDKGYRFYHGGKNKALSQKIRQKSAVF
jgi:hypothetical protein